MTPTPSDAPGYRQVPGPTGGIRFLPVEGNQCGNCGRKIADTNAYCFWCALSGGMRRVK